MTQRFQRKEHEKKLATYTPSAYSQLFAHYRSKQRSPHPLLAAIAAHSPLASRLSLTQLLNAIARLFLLSDFQILLLSYRLQELNWTIDFKSVVNNAYRVGQVCWGEGEESRRTWLMLILTGRWVKGASSEQDELVLVLREVEKVCPDLETVFQKWRQDTEQKPICPVTLNSLWKLSMLRYTKQRDYNIMVDKIIQMSHSYSTNNKQSTLLEPLKRSPPMHPLNSPRKIIHFDPQLTPPMLPISTQQEDNAVKSINLFEREQIGQSQKFNGFLDRSNSFYLPLPSMNLHSQSLRQEMDCDYIEVGLCDGESAGLVLMEEGLGVSLVMANMQNDPSSELMSLKKDVSQQA